MRRRVFLATAAVGAGTAGCTGRASNADSGSTGNSSDEGADSPEPSQNRTVRAEEQMESGQEITVGSGLTLTAANQTLTEEAATTELDLVTEEIGNRLAFVEFTARNDGDEPINLPSLGEIAMVVEGQQYSAHNRFAGELTDPVSGEWYEGIEQARSGVETSGWLLFELPGDTEIGRLSWSREVFGNPETEYLIAEWNLTFGGGSLPNFRVVEFDVSERVDPYSAVEAEITIENTGAETGTFEGAVRGADIDDPIEVSESVPPGQTDTVSVWIPYPENFISTPFETTYEIGQKSQVVRYASPTLQEGEWFEHPTGISVQTSNVETAHQIEYEIIAGQSETETAGQGLQYLIFNLQTENRSGGDAGRVNPSSFGVVDGGAVESDVALRTGEELVEPVTGTAYEPQPHLPDETLSGWVVLSVPDGLSEDAVITYRDLEYNELTPRWSF